MSELNRLTRFRRLSVHDDWSQCVICREDVPKGFELMISDPLQFIHICDDCLARAKKKHPNAVLEYSKD